jgi:penicillin amidase
MKQSLTARVLKFVNITIGILAVVAAGLIYWFAWRPLPQRSGVIDSPISAGVSVSFDTLGEPHIQANTLDDALFVQGYVTAQDRLFQMDLLRRADAGELSEVFGEIALTADREARSLRLRHIAEDAYGTLPLQDRAAMAAYTRGVNQFITTHLDCLPLEFTLANYQPRPWSAVDSLMVCLHMFRELTTTWKDELAKYQMMAGGDHDKINYLFPLRAGGEAPGSNSWAIAGSRTATGKPLLSNDMHLGYSLPGIWYMMHLRAPGLDVAGVSLPGTPGIIVGHNQRIAWGITNLQFDVQDLYIEKFDERTGRYIYHNQVEQARRELEIIRIKGRAPQEQVIWVTRRGPLFFSEGGLPMVLRWVVAEPGLIQYPILDINRAANWQEFNAALARFPGPGSNFVYADVDGNIGYHAAGKLPIRRGYTGDLPVDVSSGDFDWDSYIPYDQMPSLFNPPGGMIVTANQNPFSADYPYPVNGNFSPPYRARQIRDLLSARTGWRAQEMLGVQKDVYSGFEKFIAAQAVAAYDKRKTRNPALDPVVTLLREWNGQMDRDLAAPLAGEMLYRHILTSMLESAAPGRSAGYDFKMAPAVVEKLLRERPAGWFRDYDDMLLRALVDSVEECTRMQGRDSKRWRYGRYLQFTIDHPVIHQVPWVGRYFDLGPVQFSGSGTTVKQTTQRLAPSMRMNADPGDWDRSLLNIQIGQSGQILSNHYRDQWQAYLNGTSFPMQFRNVEPRQTLQFRTQSSAVGK